MNTNKILRVSVIVGIFLLPFICLFVANHMFFPFITGKNFAFRIIVEIITALWLILALRDKTALPKTSRLFYAFAIFIGVIFISDLLSPNSFKSFWSNYERMEGWVTLAHLFALFVVTSSMMTRKLWEWLFRTSIGVSLIVFVYGCLQLAGTLAINQGGVRLDATFGNATYLAIYMVFHIFLNLMLFSWTKRGSFWRWVYGLAILAELFILYHTATRGAILGLIGGLFLSAILFTIFEKGQTKLRKFSIGVLVGLVILVGGFIALKNTSFVQNSPVLTRFATLSFSDKTTESRFMIWNMAWQGFKDKPIFGWGQESFNYVFNKYYEPAMYSQEQWFDRTHNVFFDWLVVGGIAGILAYLSLFGFAFYYLWRKNGQFTFLEKSLITGLFAGYFFHNLTVFDNITSYILFVLVLAWIQSEAGTVPEVLAHKIHILDSGVKNRIIIPLISVVAIFVIYAVNVPAILASSELITSLSRLPDSPAGNITHFKKALSYNSLGDSEIHEQLVQTASQAASNQNVDPKIREELFALTQSEMMKQIERTPEDARYNLFAGSFFASYGDSENAIKYLTKAHNLSPNKQTIMFSLGSAYLGKGDLQNAIATMKTAFDLDPSFSEARFMYAIVLLYGKQGELADEILKPIQPEFVLGDMRILQAYYTGGFFDKALESINFFLKKDPGSVQYYFSRATILAQMGRPNQAIADLKKAVELNPNAKAQADQFIAQIKAGKGI